MTKERKPDIHEECKAEIERLRAKWQEEADLFKAYKEKMVSSYEMRGEEIDRLRHALYCIKVEYAYCTQCSASALAEMALEQKP